MQIYPLKFKPIFKQRLWGGQKLREAFNKDIPGSVKIGESWELADLPYDKSVIENGRLAGETVETLLAKYPKQITGDESFSGPFPLLIKFLDAEDFLSVQVHPDEQACRRMGKGVPKTECWYILSAAVDSVIYKGLKKGVTKAQLSEAIKKGNVADLLEKVTVKAGECHFLPAGTAHSIGAGLLIAEIQTPSDTTYRVFDFNRVDKNGKSRQLHIKEALESINFNAESEKLKVTTEGILVDCRYFKITKENKNKNNKVTFSAGEMKTLVILRGFGKIAGSDGLEVDFKAGDTLIVPAAYEGTVKFTADTQFLTITI